MKKTIFNSIIFLSVLFIPTGCNSSKITDAEKWREVEISFLSTVKYENPYTDVDFWVEFSGPGDKKIRRPGFWDGDMAWKVRFASPVDSGVWNWISYSSDSANTGLNNQKGKLQAKPYTGDNALLSHGLLKISDGKRNAVYSDSSPFLMIGDTPWALPWRGTIESVTEYAEKREEQGFNTALLMSLNPDRDAEGPRNRYDDGGFDVAFEDLKNGHINEINTSYFQYMDSLMNILVDHGIVPVYQPVFHGFGWKGQNVLGWNMDAQEYARYCRYLVARYGAMPAMYLVSADGDGRNAGILEGGEEIEKWDDYQQPTGMHYSPRFKEHEGKVYQEKEWLDFQWCQTNHGGIHQPDKVALMYENKPTKAVANGEPTYEGIRDSLNGSGWWQGNEAWLQFLSGGTMGVVYGAGGLWNWKLRPNEPGWPDWADSNVSWREAIQLPGAYYVGFLGKALSGLDITDIEKHPELAGGELCLAKPNKLFIIYLPEGGNVSVNNVPKNASVRWFDPKQGVFVAEQTTQSLNLDLNSPIDGPSVLIVDKK
jgi:hypothetical protein